MRFLDKYSAIYNLLICRLAAILDLYVIGYLYGQNDLTNESLDRKLVEKLVLVGIFEQIVQNTIFSICRLAAILNNARSRVMPRWSNVYPGHFHRGLVPLHETIEKFWVHQNVYGCMEQRQVYIVPLDIKCCICHFVNWQIHAFLSKESILFY